MGAFGTVRWEDYSTAVYVVAGILAAWGVGCMILMAKYRGERRR